MRNYEFDVPKHRKKAKKKRVIKSDHKHDYKDCLLIDAKELPHKAQFCSICGKVTNLIYFPSERLANGCYRMLWDNEVYQKYSKLPRFFFKGSFPKSVTKRNSTEEKRG